MKTKYRIIKHTIVNEETPDTVYYTVESKLFLFYTIIRCGSGITKYFWELEDARKWINEQLQPKQIKEREILEYW